MRTVRFKYIEIEVDIPDHETTAEEEDIAIEELTEPGSTEKLLRTEVEYHVTTQRVNVILEKAKELGLRVDTSNAVMMND